MTQDKVFKLDTNRFIKKKILLISTYDYDLFGIRILHSIIEKYASVKTIFFKRKFYHKGDNINLPSEKEYQLLINVIKDFKPDMVGIAVRTLFFPTAKEITKRIREISDALILWGGTHPTICPEECIRYADMLCLGEGEIPIRNFFEKGGIDSFWVKKDGQIYKGNKMVLMENLDDLPIPNNKNENKCYINNDELFYGDPVNTLRVYHTMTSRGCPFSCSYCINSNLRERYKGQKFLRLRSVEHVIKELVDLKKRSKNLRRLFFHDEMFALSNKEWINNFVRGYKEKINLPFAIEYHPKIVPVMKDSLKLLRSAGLDNMVIGIENGCENFRKKIYNRDVSDEEMVECQKTLNQLNIFCTYNLIVRNPLENIDNLKKCFNLVLRFPRPFSFHIFNLVNFPETELTNYLIRKGYSTGNFSDNNSYISVPKKKTEEDFWINLISLSSKSFIPKKLLMFISRREYFIKHQSFIYLLTRISNLIKFMIDGFRWAKNEGFSYKIIKTARANFKDYMVNYR